MLWSRRAALAACAFLATMLGILGNGPWKHLSSASTSPAYLIALNSSTAPPSKCNVSDLANHLNQSLSLLREQCLKKNPKFLVNLGTSSRLLQQVKAQLNDCSFIQTMKSKRIAVVGDSLADQFFQQFRAVYSKHSTLDLDVSYHQMPIIYDSMEVLEAKMRSLYKSADVIIFVIGPWYQFFPWQQGFTLAPGRGSCKQHGLAPATIEECRQYCGKNRRKKILQVSTPNVPGCTLSSSGKSCLWNKNDSATHSLNGSSRVVCRDTRKTNVIPLWKQHWNISNLSGHSLIDHALKDLTPDANWTSKYVAEHRESCRIKAAQGVPNATMWDRTGKDPRNHRLYGRARKFVCTPAVDSLGLPAFASDLTRLKHVIQKLELNLDGRIKYPALLWKTVSPSHHNSASGVCEGEVVGDDPCSLVNYYNPCVPLRNLKYAFTKNAVADVILRELVDDGVMQRVDTWSVDTAENSHLQHTVPAGDCLHYCFGSDIMLNWVLQAAKAMHRGLISRRF